MCMMGMMSYPFALDLKPPADTADSEVGAQFDAFQPGKFVLLLFRDQESGFFTTDIQKIHLV